MLFTVDLLMILDYRELSLELYVVDIYKNRFETVNDLYYLLHVTVSGFLSKI